MGYRCFKNNQNFNSNRYLARKNFLKEFNSMFDRITDSYVDYVLGLYEELDDVPSEESIFVQTCKSDYDQIISDSIELFKARLSEGKIDLSKFNDEVICVIFRVYSERLLRAYKSVGLFYLNGKVESEIKSLCKTKEFADIRCLDNGYLMSNAYRMVTLRDRLAENYSFLYCMFLDEYFDTIVHLLESYVSKTTVDVLPLLEEYKPQIIIPATDYKSLFSSQEDHSDSHSYIADYKVLNKLANDNGFSYVRSNGDHGIFRNENGSVVVIPQGRTIGKGLSLKIQKSIGV